MAIEVGSAFVSIVPSFKGFQQAVSKQIADSTKNVGGDAGEGVGQKLSDGILSPLAGVGAKIAGALSLTAVTAGMTSAISKAKDFDLQIRQVGATTGATGPALKTLGDLAITMGRDTVFGAGDAAQAMLELAKGGMTPATIQGGALASTLTLASAGGQSLADSATTMANALNTFGLSAADSGKVAAALAGAANASSASVDSLAEGLAQVGPSAKLAGLSIQETAAALAIFDNAGVKGSDAGTSLKTMLTRLVPQTKQAAGSMKALGLNFVDAKGSFLPLRDIAEQLRTKLNGLSDSQKSTALTTIFGADAFRAAAILADQGAAGVDNMTRATNDLDAANKMAATGTSGAAGAWENLKGSIETVQIQLGQALLPAFTSTTNALNDKVMPAVSNAVDGFSNLVAAFSRGVGGDTSTDSGALRVIAQIGEAAGNLPGTISTALSGIGDTIAAQFGDVGAKVTTALGSIDLSSLFSDLQTGASAGAAGVINGLVDAFNGIDFGPIGEKLGTGVAAALAATATVAAKLTAAIGSLLESIDWGSLAFALGRQVPTLLLGLATGILNFDWGSLLGFVGDHIVEVLIGIITIAFLPAKFLGVFAEVLGRIPLAGPLLKWGFEALVAFSKGFVKVVGKIVGVIGMGFLEGFAKVFPVVGGFLLREIPLLGTRIGVFFLDLGPKLAGFAKTALGFIGKALESYGSLLGEVIGRLFGLLFKAFELVFSRIYAPIFEFAGRILLTIGRAILEGVGNVLGAIGSALGPMAGAVLEFLGRAALAGLRGAGELIGRLAGGIAGGIGDVLGAIGRLAGGLLSRLGGALADAAAAAARGAADLIGRLVGAIGAGAGRAASAAGDVVSAAGRALGDLAGKAVSAGEDLVRGFIRGIGNLAGEAGAAAKRMAQAAIDAAKNLLHIGSPSKVFDQIGQWTVEGYVRGLDNATPSVATSAAAMAETARVNAISDLSSAASVQGAGLSSSAGGVPSVRVYIGERELTDIVRVEVAGADSSAARSLVLNRRG